MVVRPLVLLWEVVLLLPSTAGIGLLDRLGRVPASIMHPGVANCTIKWHSQPLDHFDYAEQRVWQQRYFAYDKYWKPGGPTLFYTGNEANVELYVNATGFMWERAPELGARLIFAEHRYYGLSLPLGAESTRNSSTLRWLTMEQALADYARLIFALRADSLKFSATVAIGGSYGGMLAAWLRMHYPSAVVGAIAASAPVLAFDGIDSQNSTWDSNAYWRAVTNDATVSAGAAAGCVSGVRGAWHALFAKGSSPGGRSWLSKTFKLCGGGGSLSAADMPRLTAWVLNLWDTLAMGNFPYPSNYLVFQQTQDPSVALPAWPFREACKAFDGATDEITADELLSRMATAVGVLYNVTKREPCYQLPTDPNYDGIWDYQWCTERLPQETYFTLDGKRDMFWARPRNDSAIEVHCRQKYGVGPRGTTWIGATSSFKAKPAPASNIVFSNGEYDPWRSGGVLADLSPSLQAIEVIQGAHHLDLFFSNPQDTPSVRAARQVELLAIKRWVAAAAAAR